MTVPPLTEQIDPAYRYLDRLPAGEIVKAINALDRQVAGAVERELPAITLAIEAIGKAVEAGGRIFYLGAGTSGRLGVLDAAECPPTFQVPPELVRGIIAGGEKALSRATEASEDDPAAGVRDLQQAGFTRNDVLAGIAASGNTPYVLGAVKWARELGALTVGISCTSGSELSGAVQFPIEPKPGPEIIAGSTRMRAGTATKMVLNMISTTVMIRLGHVYGNLMVNVRPSNQKLAERGRRIVEEIAGVTPERARELLRSSGGNVRAAIVMEKRHCSREEAEAALAKVNGHLRRALE